MSAFTHPVTEGDSPTDYAEIQEKNMNAQTFKRICISLTQAENACINYLVEMIFQPHPAWENIETGYRLANELGQLHSEALDGYAAVADLFEAQGASDLLKHSATTLTECLLMLDQLVEKYPKYHSL
jgi:hypothetical protein